MKAPPDPKKVIAAEKRKALENYLAGQLKQLGVEPPEREYPFAAHHVGREAGLKERLLLAGLKNWRFDFAWPEHMLAVEVEGGQWVDGAHTRGKGFTEDCEKYHHAMTLGWTVYRCETDLIKKGYACQFVERFLARSAANALSQIGKGAP